MAVQPFRKAIRRAFRETSPAPLGTSLVATWLALALARGDHDGLRRRASLFQDLSRGAELYYLAQSYFLFGDCNSALHLLDQVPEHIVDPADLAVLRAQIQIASGNVDDAWCTLEKATRKSKRIKPYVALADLVETGNDFERWSETASVAVTSGRIRAKANLADAMLKAALRGGMFDLALQLAVQDFPRQCHLPQEGRKCVGANLGEVALADIAAVLNKLGVQFFLVSGTLLGAVREGRVLPYDNDLDIGIWAEEDVARLKAAVTSSGYFFSLPQRTPWTLRVRHVNGTSIDIFRHFREASYWHGGVKAKWHNSPFGLRTKYCLGGTYLVPDDEDRYLQENYGDWRQRIADFDSLFDTPNSEIVNIYECGVHCIKKVAFFSRAGKREREIRYREYLTEQLGVNLPEV